MDRTDSVAGRVRLRRPSGRTAARDASVSVVIPCFNYGRYLELAVQSALRQVNASVEVIIVDDASVDDSLDIARRLSEADSRVRVLANATNRGPVETFNRGLARANGEFLVRLDADDLLTPGSFARAIDLARAFPTVGLVYGHPIHFSRDLPPARTRVRAWTVWPGRRWLADRCIEGNNVITSPEVLMRSAVVERVGGQRPLEHTHDMEMWLRIAAYSDVGYVEGADQAWHREHGASLSALKVNGLIDLAERRAAFETLFSANSDIDSGLELTILAGRALSFEAVSFARHQIYRSRATPELILSLREYAVEAWPPIVETTEWQRLLAHQAKIGPSVARKIRGSAFVIRRRLRYYRRLRRWHRRGVWSS